MRGEVVNSGERGKYVTSKRKWTVAAVAMAVFAAAWIAFSPYLALSGLRGAVKARDAQAINGYIDYEALRADLKAQMAAQAAIAIAKGGRGAMGAAFATAMAGPMIDAMVQPETVTRMLSGENARGPARDMRMDDEDMHVHRTSLTTFVLGKGGEKGGLRFEMRGFGWKLVGIDTGA